MTKEEAWLVWMSTSRSNVPLQTDFDVVKKTSWWAAFEAGWNSANANNDIWNQAYQMGIEAGKEIGENK